MQEKRICLSELQDDDLIDIQDNFYKAIKLKQGINSLMKSIDSYLCLVLGSHGAAGLGLVGSEHSRSGVSYHLISNFTQNGFRYKFVKLGYSGWQTGLLTLSIDLYLVLNKDTVNEKDVIPHYDMSSFDFFDDEDILTFSEDYFCKAKVVKDIFHKCFDSEKFYSYCASSLCQNIPVINKDSDLFANSQPCKVLRTDLGRWDDMTLRINFVLEAKNDLEIVTQNIIEPSLCPLDEIRNLSIL